MTVQAALGIIWDDPHPYPQVPGFLMVFLFLCTFPFMFIVFSVGILTVDGIP